MKKLASTTFALLCALTLTALPGVAQNPSQRNEAPLRTVVPPRSQTPAINNPFAPPTSLAPPPQFTPPPPPAGAPSPIRAQARTFNLDTALARLFLDLKAVTAVGELELSITNADKVEITVLPLTLYVLPDRVRTELDLSRVPVNINSSGPFTEIRAAGVNRIVTLTRCAANFRITEQVFPDAKAYVRRQLDYEDLPAGIRLERVLLGKDPTSGLEKYQATLIYINGEKRDFRLWQTTAATPQPVVVQFDIGDTLVTVRINTVQSIADGPESSARMGALFQIPADHTKHEDVGQLLQMFSARRSARPLR